MNHKTQLLILSAGLIVIGLLFYWVNFTHPAETEHKKTVKVQKEQTEKSDEESIAADENIAIAEDIDVPDQKAVESKQVKAEPDYKEVFKEKPAPQSTVERMTQGETLEKLKEKSDALIKEANERIKSKNLKTDRDSPLSETVDDLKHKIENIEKEIER